MKPAVITALLGLTAIGLTGCGSAMRDYLEKETPAQPTAAIRQDLTMPPDLRLPEPGTTAAAPDPGAAKLAETAALTAPPPEAPAPAAPGAKPAAAGNGTADDVYTRAGISVYNADGTKKTDSQLRRELQNYYLAQKKAKNPNYGTVFNMRNIFKDE